MTLPANNEFFEKAISPLVKGQFPKYFQDEFPVLVEFVKKYYEWMETEGNITYNSRRLYEYRDIDLTIDDFIVHFKEKYLKNIQLTTATATRNLVKHSLDLYRSKGSERGLQLLFRAAFGVGARIYYPSRDIFKLSDGRWTQSQYLEVILSSQNTKFLDKQITGVTSGATAYVTGVIRRTLGNNGFADILYISVPKGQFIAGEKIIADGVDYVGSVLGSLQSVVLDELGSGAGFSVGDLVDIYSARGQEALGRVSEIGELGGGVFFSLLDGGYGYTANSLVFISEKTLTFAANTSNATLATLQGFYQPLANLSYENANGLWDVGSNVYTYHANGDPKGVGTVIGSTQTTNSVGELFVFIQSGSLEDNAIYTAGNTVGANLLVSNGYWNVYATGNVVGWYTANSGDFKVALMTVNNSFQVGYNAYNTNSFSESIIQVSEGSGANVGISTMFQYEETVSLPTELIEAFQNVALNANTFGMGGNTSANISSIIAEAIAWQNVSFGSIQFLVGENPGTEYNDPPLVYVYEPLSFVFQRRDSIIRFENATATFYVGELVTQNTTSARGLIKSTNSTHMTIKELRVSPQNYFVINDTIVGESSGAQATPKEINQLADTLPMGYNAVIQTNVASVAGSVTAIEILKSGFGFIHDEVVNFANLEISETVGIAIANVSSYGLGQGYYSSAGGVLSGSKKLYDGYYYQDFSYEIISSVQLKKYESILRNVVHMAGFVFFGSLETDEAALTEVSSEDDITIVPGV